MQSVESFLERTFTKMGHCHSGAVAPVDAPALSQAIHGTTGVPPQKTYGEEGVCSNVSNSLIHGRWGPSVIEGTDEHPNETRDENPCEEGIQQRPTKKKNIVDCKKLRAAEKRNRRLKLAREMNLIDERQQELDQIRKSRLRKQEAPHINP